MNKFLKSMRLSFPHQIKINWIEKDYSEFTENVRKCEVITENGNFNMIIDERFNQIDFSKNSKNWPILVNFLTEQYDLVKSKDFRYKKESGIDGSKNLLLETFIDQLKITNRDYKIINLLNK